MLDTVADQVMAYLTAARWFAGKGRLVTLRSLTPLPWLNETAEFFAESAPAVRLEIAEVAYAVEQDPDDQPAAEDPAWAGGPRQPVTPEANGPREFYQLALSYRRAPHPDLHFAEVARFEHPELGSVVAYDAARDPEACRVLLRALVDEARLSDRDTTARFHRTDRPGLTADLAPRVFTGQQSNTSVVLGDVAMLKLFRRLELGRNLDIEVHDALNRAGVNDVAALFGWAEGSWTSDGVTCDADLAMVVELLRQATDGWGLALDQLEAGRSFAAEAEALGRALAETHAALRDAFPVTEVPGRTVAEVMKARLSTAATTAPALLSPRGRAAQLLRGPGGPDARHPAGARRLPSGPDPAHPGRVEDHRLRGRAGQDHGRTRRPGQRLARRRRHASLLRLRSGQRAGDRAARAGRKNAGRRSCAGTPAVTWTRSRPPRSARTRRTRRSTR